MEHVQRNTNNGWIALFALLAGITMLFAALASAYVVRVLETGLLKSPLPGALWVSTTLILMSSIVLEVARGAARRGRWRDARRYLGLSTFLGVAFLGAQVVGWQQLMAMGYYLQSLPHSSFLYLLTWLHGLHILGGLVWLFRTRGRLAGLRPVLQVAATEGGARWPAGESSADYAASFAALSQTAIYWHYLGVLWLFLFALLFVV